MLSNNKYLIKDEALKILLKTFPDFVQFDISLAFPAFKETKGKPEADDSNNTSGEHSNLEVNKNKSLLKNADNTFFFLFLEKINFLILKKNSVNFFKNINRNSKLLN